MEHNFVLYIKTRRRTPKMLESSNLFKCLVISISTLLMLRSGEADSSVHILSKLGVSSHGPIPIEKTIYLNYRKIYICQYKCFQNQHRPTNFGYCHEFGVNLVCASHLNWMKYIYNQLICCSFETSMSIQYLSPIVYKETK